MRKYQSVLLSSVAVMMLGASPNAQADCSTTVIGAVTKVLCNPATGLAVTGVAGANDITVDSGSLPSITSVLGSNTITLTEAAVSGSITTGASGDVIKHQGGKVGTVTMGDGANSYDLYRTTGEVTDVIGGVDVDTVTIYDGKVTGKIDAGNGDNFVTVLGGAVASVVAGTGVDTLQVSGGTVGTVNLGAGKNVLTMNGGTINEITAGSGDDTVNWQGGQINTLNLGDGSDKLNLLSGANIGSLATPTILDGGDDSSIDDTYIDTLTANNVKMTNVTLKNWEKMNIGDSTITGDLTTGGGDLTLTNTNITGNIIGGDKADNLTLTGTTTVTGNVNLGNGDNTATLNPGTTITGNLTTGTGADTLNLVGGNINGNVDLGSGDNTANLNAGTIGGNLTTGDGKDILNLNGATVTGNVNLGGGNNIANINTGLISGNLVAGAGDDTLNQTGGTITGNVDLGNGTNIAHISGGTIGGNLLGGTGADTLNLSGTAIIKGDALLGEGNNTANISGGQIVGDLIAGAGDDKLVLTGGVIGGDVNVGNGTNTAEISAGTIKGDVLGGTGVDTVTVSGTSNIVGGISLGDGANILDIKGGTVGGPIVLGKDADTFTQSGGTVKGVDLGAGDDKSTVTGGTIDGTLALGEGANTATISGGTITGQVTGGAGVDTVTVSGTSNIVGGISLGDGANILDIKGGTVGGPIVLGKDADTFTQSGGTVKGVDLGAGGDTATISGGKIEGTLALGEGDNTATIKGDAVITGQVTGGTGVDKVTVSDTANIVGGISLGDGANILDIKGGTVGGPIVLGKDADTFTQSGGTVKGVDLGAGDDKSIVTGGTIDGTLALGKGANTATISGGTITGQVTGGAGVDKVTVSDTANIEGGISLGAGADELEVKGGTVSGPIALGEGADKYTQSGGAVKSVDLGAGDDEGSWTGGTLASLNAGEGADKFTVSSPLYKGTEVLDGGAGVDEITFANITAQPADGTIINWEALKFVNSNITITDKTITPPGGTAPKLTTLSACGGTLTAGGALQVGTLSGCQTNDTLIAKDNAKIDTIQGGGGSDVINVLDNAEVTGIVNGGGPGADNHAELDGGDIIKINTTKGVGGIDAGLGDDTVAWTNGTVGASGIVLGDGKDALTIESASYKGDTLIAGGAGDDTVTIRNLGTAALPLVLTGSTISGVESLVFDNTAFKLATGTLDLGSPTGVLNLKNGSLFDGTLGLILNGSMDIDATSTFKAEGTASSLYEISGDLTNKGLIDMKNGVVGEKIHVLGDYVGGGRIEMDFNSETLLADSITIDGDATGQTQLVVSNTSLLGKDTGPNGVTLATVKGTQSADAFSLVSSTGRSVSGRIVGGAYLYGLVYENGKWVLKSTLRDASTSTIYLGTQTAEISRIMLGTRSERVGFQERDMNTAGTVYHKGKKVKSEGERTYLDGSNVWGRAFGASSKGIVNDSLNGNVTNKQNSQALQFGADVLTYYGENGSRGRVGMYGGYAMVQGELSKGNINGGTMSTTGLGGGLYASWDDANDWYVDGVIQGHRTSAEGGKGTLSALSTSGTVWSGSLEGGKMFKISDNASFEAQAQMVFTAGGLEGGIDAAGQKVTYGNAPTLAARVGGRLKSEDLHMPSDNLWASGWLKADLWTTLPLGAQTMNIGSTKIDYAQKGTWLDMGAALDIQAAKNVNFNIQASVEVGLDKQHLGAKGQIGARWEF